MEAPNIIITGRPRRIMGEPASCLDPKCWLVSYWATDCLPGFGQIQNGYNLHNFKPVLPAPPPVPDYRSSPEAPTYQKKLNLSSAEQYPEEPADTGDAYVNPLCTIASPLGHAKFNKSGRQLAGRSSGQRQNSKRNYGG